MDVSLIICTRNRAGPLQRCLDAVAKLAFGGSWELVLVDNGSSDGTRETIERFARGSAFPVRYVHEPVPGLSNARNAGLAVAGGDLIAFTDDDCYPEPDMLTHVARAFDRPDVGYVSGRIMLYDPDDYPATINESRVPVEFSPGRYLNPGAIKGANLSFRRAALDEIGGFDPLFGSGALFPAEDVDAAARIGLRGWAGRYAPDVVVWHHHGRKAADIGSLHKAYDYGRGAYHAKLLVKERAFSAGLRGWAGLPLRVVRYRPATIIWEIAGAARYLYVSFGRKAFRPT